MKFQDDNLQYQRMMYKVWAYQFSLLSKWSLETYFYVLLRQNLHVGRGKKIRETLGEGWRERKGGIEKEIGKSKLKIQLLDYIMVQIPFYYFENSDI